MLISEKPGLWSRLHAPAGSILAAKIDITLADLRPALRPTGIGAMSKQHPKTTDHRDSDMGRHLGRRHASESPYIAPSQNSSRRRNKAGLLSKAVEGVTVVPRIHTENP